jgi:hypothetical protein
MARSAPAAQTAIQLLEEAPMHGFFNAVLGPNVNSKHCRSLGAGAYLLGPVMLVILVVTACGLRPRRLLTLR